MKRFENDSWYKFDMNMKDKKLILWGGGARCRDYIKLLKERYEVIVIIDNDSGKWETKLEDISIKPPSVLQKWIENYCVLITIDNPGKVASQLESMGIR